MSDMTADEFFDELNHVDQEVPEGLERDRWGRPLIVPTEGGEPVAYTRVSTMANYLDNASGLTKWKTRMITRGMGLDEELAGLAAALPCFTGDRKKDGPTNALLDEYAEEAMQRAGAHAKRNWGTVVHGYTEDGRQGDPTVPARMKSDVDSYWESVEARHVELIATEVFVVNDELRCAGTFDDLYYTYGYGLIVGDKKGLPLDTPLPTTSGWTTMGEVREGDLLLGRDGKPAKVVSKSQVHHKPCVRLVFDDGTSQVCDVDHRWPVSETPSGRVEVVRAGDIRGRRARGKQVQVAVPEALDLPDVDLPIDPYVLGAWLGDGNRSRAEISNPEGWIFDEIARRGYGFGKDISGRPGGCPQRTINGLRKQLIENGLIGNKHIPAQYLRASRAQRLALLQGLMDTDGCWNVGRRHAIITLVDEDLTRQVHELALTLGQRARIWPVKYSGFGITGTAWTVTFTPRGIAPFLLPRKADKVNIRNSVRSSRRMVVDVVDVDQVPTQCIEVDSVDRTYLCGRDMLVTHNTGREKIHSVLIQMAIYANSKVYNIETGDRIDISQLAVNKLPKRYPVNLKHALYVHIPKGEGRTRFVEADIEKGYEAAKLAAAVRDWNRNKQGLIRDVDDEMLASANTQACWQALGDATTKQELVGIANHFNGLGVWNQQMTDWGGARIASGEIR